VAPRQLSAFSVDPAMHGERRGKHDAPESLQMRPISGDNFDVPSANDGEPPRPTRKSAFSKHAHKPPAKSCSGWSHRFTSSFGAGPA